MPVMDTVLGLRLGGAEREYEARITYSGDTFYARPHGLELKIGKTWMDHSNLLGLIGESPQLVDELREHWAGRLAYDRALAADLRR